MNKRFIFSVTAIALSLSSFCQNYYYKLTFTAAENQSYTRLDSILVINESRNCDTMLYFPDTVLILSGKGELPDPGGDCPRVISYYPNPVMDKMIIRIYVPFAHEVTLKVSDVIGKTLVHQNLPLAKGYHNFSFTPGAWGIYIISASWKGCRAYVKTVNISEDIFRSPGLEYTGYDPVGSSSIGNGNHSGFLFKPGDALRFTGFVWNMHDQILDSPDGNENYILHYSTSFHCLDIPTVFYEGFTYHTIQIGTQCWFLENLNAGSRINGGMDQADNGIIEKYCYDNNEIYCDRYGGLYQWDEAMQYSDSEGAKGICPAGWHVPSDNDWCILTKYLDSSTDCGIIGWSGNDVGGKLKQAGTTDWCSPNTGATNSSGFTALPGGNRQYPGVFMDIPCTGVFWTSTNYNGLDAYYRSLWNFRTEIGRSYSPKQERAFSVRCLKDEGGQLPSVTTDDVTNILETSANGGGNVITDGGSPVTSRGVCWSRWNNPNTGDSHTIDGSGTGHFSSNLTGLMPNTKYSVRAYATNSLGTAYGNEVTFKTSAEVNCPCGMPLTWEGQAYQTIQIGAQCWFRENLNTGIMIPGSQNQANNGISEKYCYQDDPGNCSLYGGLYQWNEAMQYVSIEGSRGICPDGWHIPSDQEWCTLTRFIDFTVECDAYGLNGTDAGYKMKSTTGWTGGGNGSNGSGFTILPHGYRNQNGDFINKGFNAPSWTSTSTPSHVLRDWYSTASGIYRFMYGSGSGEAYGIRCVKDLSDASCPGTPTVVHQGKIYNTVQIGNQCWFRENLNAGSMINGFDYPSDNGVVEKYCYNNLPSNCDLYGGLYLWDEMMGYSSQEGVKGICPDGWHVPTDADWCILERYVDPTVTCNSLYWRGVDAGSDLKECGTTHWEPPNAGATNSSGFTTLPGGYRNWDGTFILRYHQGTLWTSSIAGDRAWYRNIFSDQTGVYRWNYPFDYGFSVRCLKNSSQ